MKNRMKIVVSAFTTAFILALYPANSITCSDDCGSITCPGATWCGIAWTEDGHTVYDCEGGVTSTVNNCQDKSIAGV